jgi:hypothetical protein
MTYSAAFDMIEETTTSTGAGDITLDGPVQGRLRFSTRLANGSYFTYRIIAEDGSYHEIGLGKMLSESSIQRISAHGARFDSGTSAWIAFGSPYSMPAGMKKVALVQAAANAPISSYCPPYDGPRIADAAAVTNGLAWGRGAKVNSGANGIALGYLATSENGGAALGMTAYALGASSLAAPTGRTETSAKGAVALYGAKARDGFCVLMSAHMDRLSTYQAYAQAGRITRGFHSPGGATVTLKMVTDVQDAGFYYDLQIFGHRDDSNNGAYAGAYAARIRAIVVGIALGTPTILHSAVSDELRVGTGSTISAPTIAAVTGQSWTVSAAGNVGENWTWTMTGSVVAGMIES